MLIQIEKSKRIPTDLPQLWVLNELKELPSALINADERNWVKEQLKHDKRHLIRIPRAKNLLYLCFTKEASTEESMLEGFRTMGDKLGRQLNEQKITQIAVTASASCGAKLFALCEGLMLGNYQFLKYFSKAESMTNTLSKIVITHESPYLC